MGVISNLMFAVGFKVTSKDLNKADRDINKLKGNVDGLDNNINKTKRSTRSLIGAFAGLSSSGHMFAGIKTSADWLAAALGGTAAAVSFFSKSIGGAMDLEQTQMQIEALAGNAKKGKEIFDMVNDMGLKSVFSEKDFLNAGKAFLPITKDVKELNKMLSVTERLASANPLEGMEGAAFSIKELASGDIASVAERFNIGKSDLRKAGFDSTKDYKNNIAALDRVLTQYGYTQEYINKVNNSGAAAWDIFKSNISSAIAKSGTAAMNLLKGPLEEINQWLGAGGVGNISSVLSKGLAGFVKFAIGVGRSAGSFITGFRDGFERAGRIVSGTWKFLQLKASQLYEKHKETFDAIAAGAQTAWRFLQDAATPVLYFIQYQALPGIVSALSLVADGVLYVADGFVAAGQWFKANWEWIEPFVIGLGVSFAAYGLALAAVQAQMLIVQGATKAWAAAQWLLNVALNANPIGLIVIAIGLLIGAGVLLMKNWDTISQWASDTWVKIGNFFKSGANEIIVSINKIIDGINNLTGTQIPKLQEFQLDYSVQMRTMQEKRQSRNLSVDGSFAKGLDYVPRDGFIAELHKGERVLTAEENRAYTPATAPATTNVSNHNNMSKQVYEINVNVSGGGVTSDKGPIIVEQIKLVVQEIVESSMRRYGLPEGAN